MTTRITGLSNSGLDTDALVKNLMTAQRTKYDKINQQKTLLEWKKTDYNTMSTALASFRNSTVFNFKMSSSLNSTAATSTDATKVTATATADAASFNHVLNVTSLATSASMASSGTATWSAPGADTTIDINGTAVAVKTTDTANDLASRINNTAGLNIKANYDATLNRFFMYSTVAGGASKIDLSAASNQTGDAQTLLSGLKLNTATPTTATGNLGKNSDFTLDGVSGTTLGITTNDFAVSGVKYSLKGIGTASVAVSSDTDKVVANVKAFIAAYNTMLGSINTEINETKYKDYLPLTADQKTAMKDSDITAWETKAKSGLLKNDATLNTLSYSLRENFSSSISGLTGKYTSAASIGITTGLYTERGKLYLDDAGEKKLRAALAEDPQVVQKIFGTLGSSTSTNGIATRLTDTLQTAITKIKTDAGITASATSDYTSVLGKKINAYASNLLDMDKNLKTMENNYYLKFSRMETALTKINSQSSWLTQQLK